ncbi:hypothetical protein CFAM422_006247 [Trichoderma lentiforme]|uniref:Uncharacterized protein n=1 Tax=Trichoderma lentiforme TaxID=1567552 RepID=A0A9P4XFC9_9HYPO|nr:hypothetical protein CFAM422_006247 [Trichoderma lentiforme]
MSYNATGDTLYLYPGEIDLIDPPSQIDSGKTAEIRYHPAEKSSCIYGDKNGSEFFIGVGSEDGNSIHNINGLVVREESSNERGQETYRITRQ